MANAPSEPLTLQEAKMQLRAAGQRLTIAGLLRSHPWPLLSVALSFGLLAGGRRQSGVAARFMLQQFAPVVFSALLGRGKTS